MVAVCVSTLGICSCAEKKEFIFLCAGERADATWSLSSGQLERKREQEWEREWAMRKCVNLVCNIIDGGIIITTCASAVRTFLYVLCLSSLPPVHPHTLCFLSLRWNLIGAAKHQLNCYLLLSVCVCVCVHLSPLPPSTILLWMVPTSKYVVVSYLLHDQTRQWWSHGQNVHKCCD